MESSVLDDYALGHLNEADRQKLLHLRTISPEVDAALKEIEAGIKELREGANTIPPAGLSAKIDAANELIKTTYTQNLEKHTATRPLEVEDTSTHIRIKKVWKGVLICSLLLITILIGLALYFYLGSQQISG